MADRQNYPGLNQGPYGEGSQGYPPQGYPPQGGYPTQGYPPQNYPPQSGYPSQSGYGQETSGYPPHTNFASSGYPPTAGYGSTTTSSSVHGGGYPQQGGYGEAAGYSYPQAQPAQFASGHGYAPPQQQSQQGTQTNHQGTKVEDPAKKKNDKFGELGGLASGAYAMYKKHGQKPDSSHSSATTTPPQTTAPNQANASGIPPKKSGGELGGLASGAYALYKQYNVKVESGQESKHRMETLQGAAHLASDGFSYFERHQGKKELPEGAFNIGEPGTKPNF